MRIDNPGPREVEPSSKAQDRGGAASPTHTSDIAEVSTHAASPELKALREAVGQVPAVRPALVAEISRRLRLGELSSSQTLERTAEALTVVSGNGTRPQAESIALPLTDLEAALGVLPLARESVVAEASRKLRAGELSTDETIQQTASVLLE